jgi:hypothetical protein
MFKGSRSVSPGIILLIYTNLRAKTREVKRESRKAEGV